jgi:hypothetical protein
MIYLEFDKPINGDLLVSQFANAGIITEVVVYNQNQIQLNGADENQRELCQSILDAHTVPIINKPTIEDKLASVGLSLDELKAALGGN